MFLKLCGRCELNDRYITKLGAKTIQGVSVWEFACIPLRGKLKTVKSPQEAAAMLRRLGWLEKDGQLCELLQRQGFAGFAVVDGDGAAVVVV